MIRCQVCRTPIHPPSEEVEIGASVFCPICYVNATVEEKNGVRFYQYRQSKAYDWVIREQRTGTIEQY